MLTQISSPQRSSASSGPVEMLEDCHLRIRHFVQLSRTLAEAQEAPQAQVAEAADAIFRYFSQSLPLHEADENETLFPRLQRIAPLGSPLRDAAKAMVEQHHAIEELVFELAAVCGAIRREPERLPALSSQLQHTAEALDEVFTVHLQMEETVIFPAVAKFPAEELQAMTREMQRRRNPGDSGIRLIK
jgi:hemerythrin-like domain-containing protein